MQPQGHHVKLIKRHAHAIFGREQIILRLPNDKNRLIWAADSEPRADVHAVGW
jgi:hypothetical protein